MLVFILDSTTNLLLIWSYMFIYNFTLLVIFYSIFQVVNSKLTTLVNLNQLTSDTFLTKVLIISLFSMAGVPPFWGFFSKLFIFNLLNNFNFFILFIFFFVLVFFGLYFYIQNIRFLNATNSTNFFFVFNNNLRVVPLFYNLTNLLTFFIVSGFVFTDDLFLVIIWLIS